MSFYNVRVTPDCRWKSVQVAGREFVKDTAIRLPGAAVTDGIRNSPLLLVEEIVEPVKPAETDAPSTTPPEPSADVIIKPQDGIQDAEATAASKVLSQQRREEKSKRGKNG